jgi:ABC-3C protein
VEAILKLGELKLADAKREFGFFGLEGFEQLIFSLKPHKIEALLGLAATVQDQQNFQAAELSSLVSSVIAAADAIPIDVTEIRPVPSDKLSFNKLPGHWQSLIAGGWQNAHFVQEYLERHHEPMTGEITAQAFRTRYQYLKLQGLASGDIMSFLYEDTVGTGSVSAGRQVAAQALLAYLFESCDIFESVEPKVAAQ